MHRCLPFRLALSMILFPIYKESLKHTNSIATTSSTMALAAADAPHSSSMANSTNSLSRGKNASTKLSNSICEASPNINAGHANRVCRYNMIWERYGENLK